MTVSANVAISLDGKLGPEVFEPGAFSSRADRARMRALREQADAIVAGAETMRQANPPLGLESQKAQERRAFKKYPPQPAAVVLTRAGERLEAASRFWTHPGRKILITTDVGARALTALAKQHDVEICEVLASDEGVDVAAAQRALAARGLTKLLVEGGGKLIASFLRAQLLERLYVTLTPCLLGGNHAPTLVDGVAYNLLNRVKLKLVESTVAEDELFLVYHVERS